MPDATDQATPGFGVALKPGARQRAAAIRLMAFDVDGTLTDGRIVIGAKGELAKSFSVHDGQGLRLLMDQGVTVAWITARESEIVKRRASELKIPFVIQGCRDKTRALRELATKLRIDLAACGFMGDDLPDLAPMRASGFAACVVNAEPMLLPEAHWRSERPGGDGAVRELCRFVLHAQGKLAIAVAAYAGDERRDAA
ncbi:MAG: HAD-IIIA family hydrolase [Burkholderiaceae bacterium]